MSSSCHKLMESSIQKPEAGSLQFQPNISRPTSPLQLPISEDNLKKEVTPPTYIGNLYSTLQRNSVYPTYASSSDHGMRSLPLVRRPKTTSGKKKLLLRAPDLNWVIDRSRETLVQIGPVSSSLTNQDSLMIFPQYTLQRFSIPTG